MNIRAVLFDIYGTLLEVGPAPADADERWQRLFRGQLGIEPPLDRLEFSIACNQVIARHHAAARARGIAWPEVHWPSVVAEVVPQLAQLPGPAKDDFLFQQMQTGRATWMNAGMADLLRRLREQHYLLGIVSNAQGYTVRELDEALASQGLARSIFELDLCFWSYAYGFSKPDPHVFQILTARLIAHGIEPQETLMVGDRLDNDIQPARAHGWQTWHLGGEADGEMVRLREFLSRPQSQASP